MRDAAQLTYMGYCMNIRRYLAICACIILMATAGCGQKAEGPSLKKVSIAFQSWIGYGPFYLGAEKGFFKDEGIELFFVDEQLDSARRDAFKEGMLDCEAGTLDLLVTKRAQDTPVVAVLELDQSFGGDGIVAAKEIKSLEDLIGKKVAFARDDVGETFISYVFYKRGLLLKDIDIISRESEKVAAAFLNGEADAVVTWEPWLSAALKRPGAHILISSRNVPGVIIDTLNIREDIVKNDPRLVQGLLRGWFKAVEYYQEYPLEASEIIAKYYNISADEYRNNITGLKWTGYKEQADPERLKSWLEVFDTVSDIKFKNGRIGYKPPAQTAIDSAFLKKLYEDSQ